MTQPIDDVLARVNHTQSGKNQWDANCPCRNDDDNPSLRISVGNQNQVLMKCLRGGGCDLGEICTSIGLEVGDLFPKDTPKPKKSQLELVDTYRYFYEGGELAMEVLRYVDERGKKTFRQRRPDESGGWNWSTSDIEKPLYRLPQVLQAKEEGRPIYIVEGEKDVHSLEALGKTATTNAGGAGGQGQKKWTEKHTETLAGANIIIICDNDEAGYLHARSINRDLTDAGCTVKVFKPSTYPDVSDMIQDGKSLQEGLVPFFDPLNGIITEEEGFIDRLVPKHTANFGINVDYKIFDFFMLFERKTGFSTAAGGMWWSTGPNNNGHTGWLTSMQKLGIDGIFASLNFIPANMTRQVTPIVDEGDVVGTIDYAVFQASNGAVVLPIPVEGKEQEWEETANDFAHAFPGYSTNYIEDGSYTRLREISFGVNLDQYLPSLKLDGAISGLRFFASAQNVKLWRPKGTRTVDPELNMAGAITGAIGTTNSGYRSVESNTMPYPTIYNIGFNIRF